MLSSVAPAFKKPVVINTIKMGKNSFFISLDYNLFVFIFKFFLKAKIDFSRTTIVKKTVKKVYKFYH